MVDTYGKSYLKKIRVFQTVNEQLRILRKKYDLYIVTDGSENQKLVIDALGIRNHFKDVFTSEASRAMKPGGSIFRYALKKTGLKPSEVIVVGDLFESDIKGSSLMFLQSIWINPTGEKPMESCPGLVAVIKDIRELASTLEKLGI